MNLDIGTSIRLPAGQEAGTIKEVVLDPDGKGAVSLIMSTSDLIRRDVVVPVALLRMAPGDVIEIEATPDEIANLPDYRQAELAVDPAEWNSPNAYDPGAAGAPFPADEIAPILPVVEYENVPEGGIAVHQGTRVMCIDRSVGVVDEVVLDEQDQLQAFIVRPDDVGAPDFRVPVTLVYRTTEDIVYLNCKYAELPDYAEPLLEENEEPEARPLI
jgi:sporulation protein YlmC with PRC-barrel domain